MGFLRLLESIRIPALNVFFSGITYCGDEIAFMVAAFALFWCVNKRTGYYAFLVGLFGTVGNQWLKIACRIPRPWVLDPNFTIVESARAAATGYSFPSGHTQNAVGHVRRDGTADRAEVGARRVHRADRAGAVFTDVSRRAYAAGRRRGVFDGGGAAGAVLSGCSGRNRRWRRGCRGC